MAASLKSESLQHGGERSSALLAALLGHDGLAFLNCMIPLRFLRATYMYYSIERMAGCIIK